MVDNFQYTYLLGSLIALPPWLYLFIHRKDCRKEILIASFCVVILAIIWAPWFLKDYWMPEYVHSYFFKNWRLGGGEDFLYGFFLGGISNVIYEEVFGKRFCKRRDRKHHWSWFLIPFFALFFLVFGLPVYFGINSIYASLVSFFILSIFMIYFRRDLFVDSLVSGFLVGLLTLLSYLVFLAFFPGVIHSWWLIPNLSGIFILEVPIEELLWAFGVGMVAGPFYEFFMGLKFKKS